MMPSLVPTLQKMKGFMTTIKAGDLWVAEIIFTDGSASKKRPVLILWIDGTDVVVAAVTSSKPRTQVEKMTLATVDSAFDRYQIDQLQSQLPTARYANDADNFSDFYDSIDLLQLVTMPEITC